MSETTQALGTPVDLVLGPPPWAEDVEAWLEVSNAEEIADDIERYTLDQVARAVAAERKRISALMEAHTGVGLATVEYLEAMRHGLKPQAG